MDKKKIDRKIYSQMNMKKKWIHIVLVTDFLEQIC